jgi:hypothetical protein
MITWQNTYGISEKNANPSIVQTTDGGYVLAGNISKLVNETLTDIWIIRLDQWGTVIWDKIIGNNGIAGVYSIKSTLDGGFIISGFNSESGQYFDGVMWIIKFNENGDTLWSRKDYQPNIVAYDIVTTYDSSYVALGSDYAAETGDLVLIKVGSDGHAIWDRHYYSYEHSGVWFDLEQTADSGFIAAGCLFHDYTLLYDAGIMKFNQNGDSLWTGYYGTEGFETSHAVEQLKDGNLLLSTFEGQYDKGYSHCTFYKLEPNGNVIWQKTYNSFGSYSIHSVEQTFDGGFIAAGDVWNVNILGDLIIFRLDQEGDTLWTRIYSDNDRSYGGEIHQVQDGGYIVCATSKGYPPSIDNKLWVLKLDESGLVSTGNNPPDGDDPEIKVYPNPAKDYALFEIRSTSILHEPVILRLYDQSGRLIKFEKHTLDDNSGGIMHLNFAQFPAGIYVYHLTGNSFSHTDKICITQ